MKHCPKCGSSNIEDGDYFCRDCGQALGSKTAPIDWQNKPIIVAIMVVASVFAIIGFVLGTQTLSETADAVVPDSSELPAGARNAISEFSSSLEIINYTKAEYPTAINHAQPNQVRELWCVNTVDQYGNHLLRVYRIGGGWSADLLPDWEADRVGCNW